MEYLKAALVSYILPAMAAFEQANVFMTKALGLDKSPAKWCQAVSP